MFRIRELIRGLRCEVDFRCAINQAPKDKSQLEFWPHEKRARLFLLLRSSFAAVQQANIPRILRRF